MLTTMGKKKGAIFSDKPLSLVFNDGLNSTESLTSLFASQLYPIKNGHRQIS
jgi:hypothetical protein